MQRKAVKWEWWPIEKVIPYDRNARVHNADQVQQIAASIRQFGWQNAILVDTAGVIIAGHGRRAAGELNAQDHVPVVVAKDLSPEQVRQLRLADNKIAENSTWDQSLLAIEMMELRDLGIDLSITGFAAPDIEKMIAEFGYGEAAKGTVADTGKKGSLTDKFGVPPFSVLNAREGWWQERKRQWMALGIKSEIGRDAEAYPGQDRLNAQRGQAVAASGVSVFDPVLCELAYRWFCPEGGTVLDPFAGGSVRGLVASHCERAYVGIDLRAEQVEANIDQIGIANKSFTPIWMQGDSRNIGKIAKGVKADMVFSCPPYGDIEVYSDDAADISGLDYSEFRAAYAQIIAATCKMLKPDRFACFVVGDIRDKKTGAYQNFVGDTVEAFRAAGLAFYNEAILVTMAGTLPIRAGKQFVQTRKLGKTHQNVLVFVKGDAKKATEACGICDFGDVGDTDAESDIEAVA